MPSPFRSAHVSESFRWRSKWAWAICSGEREETPSSSRRCCRAIAGWESTEAGATTTKKVVMAMAVGVDNVLIMMSTVVFVDRWVDNASTGRRMDRWRESGSTSRVQLKTKTSKQQVLCENVSVPDDNGTMVTRVGRSCHPLMIVVGGWFWSPQQQQT